MILPDASIARAAYFTSRIPTVAACTLLTGLAACSGRPAPAAAPIAQDMGHVLRDFDDIGAVRFPMVRTGSVLPSELQRPMSWHWDGPVDQAVRILAARIGYAADTVGQPVAPVLHFDIEHGTAASILDEMAAALETRASIAVDVPHHLIRVAWHA